MLLAAGRSQRYGSDKRLATLPDGNTLLVASARCYRALPWPLYLVVRAADVPLREQLHTQLRKHHPAVHWVVAGDAELGMGHSLAAGAKALLAAGVGEALVGLGDMPQIQPDTIAACAAALASQPDAIVRPRFQGRPGNPVGFSGAMLTALTGATGDTGARPLLKDQADRIIWLDVEDPGIVADVDRPADLPSGWTR